MFPDSSDQSSATVKIPPNPPGRGAENQGHQPCVVLFFSLSADRSVSRRKTPPPPPLEGGPKTSAGTLVFCRTAFFLASCVLRLASFFLPLSHSPLLPFRLSLRPASCVILQLLAIFKFSNSSPLVPLSHSPFPPLSPSPLHFPFRCQRSGIYLLILSLHNYSGTAVIIKGFTL